MFKSWKKDDLFTIPENTFSIYLQYDGTPDCIISYVDGSFDKTFSGFGVYFEPIHNLFLPDLKGPVRGSKSNNRAELTSILESIKACIGLDRNVHI